MPQIPRIPISYVYETSKARQVVLTGLVFIETGCGARLSGGGGWVTCRKNRRLKSFDYQQFRESAIAAIFRKSSKIRHGIRHIPWENGYVESFNGKLPDELLNRELFPGLEDARRVIDRWRLEDNHRQPHSALDYQTPAAFAANCVLQDSATLGPSDHSPATDPGFSHSGCEDANC